MPFSDFIGNGAIVGRLRAKLGEGRFPHGLIFSGPEGIGKRAFAVMLAQALNCDDMGPADFCGLCGACRRIAAGTHPDIQFVTVEEEASEIKIAQIRELLRVLEYRPLEGRNKVFMIDPAGAMGPAAANALLRGLEEPPENNYWILLAANPQELLITVRSRCQVYRFAPLSREEIRACGVEDELVVRWSQGSVGRARSADAAALRAQREPLLEFFEHAAGAGPAQFAAMMAESARHNPRKQPRSEFRNNKASRGVLRADLI
jgi:DNA polymerase-3 subunit delta'